MFKLPKSSAQKKSKLFFTTKKIQKLNFIPQKHIERGWKKEGHKN